MISIDREFHFTGEMTIKRSHLLGANSQPKDDKTNWLFLKIEERQFSFIYKIDEPINASYDNPFSAKLSFMLIDEVKKILKSNQSYEVLRGPETIGMVKIVSTLE